MKKIIGVISALLITFTLSAQITLSGTLTGLGVIDSSTMQAKRLAYASVNNITSGSVIYTKKDGTYEIRCKAGDTIEYKYLGYFTYRYILPKNTNDLTATNDVSLKLKTRVLQEIRFKGLTKYQVDSMERAERYEKPLAYQQTTSLMNPVTSIYQQFSKKYKNLRQFQAQYQSFEEQKYIDTKYSYELVKETIGLDGDGAAYFMNAYPMEYKFARLASELEIKMWVINNYKAYQLIKDSVQNRMLQMEKLEAQKK